MPVQNTIKYSSNLIFLGTIPKSFSVNIELTAMSVQKKTIKYSSAIFFWSYVEIKIAKSLIGVLFGQKLI